MPGPRYAQSVLDLVQRLLFPLYTQIFFTSVLSLISHFFLNVCVSVSMCCCFCWFFFVFYHPVPQKSSCEVQEFESLFFYQLAFRKRDQQIYKCPFCSFLLNSLFFSKKQNKNTEVHRRSSSTGFPWRRAEDSKKKEMISTQKKMLFWQTYNKHVYCFYSTLTIGYMHFSIPRSIFQYSLHNSSQFGLHWITFHCSGTKCIQLPHCFKFHELISDSN